MRDFKINELETQENPHPGPLHLGEGLKGWALITLQLYNL